MIRKIAYAFGSAVFVLMGSSIYIALKEDEEPDPPDVQDSLAH